MSILKFYLFGQFRLQCDDRVWYGPESAKAHELLCYLLLHSAKPHRREHLASLLWEDYSTAQSKKCLRQSLWQLQSACASFLGAASDNLLLVTSEWVRLNPEVDLWKDVGVFEQTYTAFPSDANMNANCAGVLDNAVQLYQGDLLNGFYQDWCLFERERLQNIYLSLLDQLIGYYERGRAYATALDYGARLLRHDPASERAHQQMMRIHYLAGDRTEALRQYERCVVALRDELGVEPSGTTSALYEQIRTDHLEPVLTTSSLNPHSSDTLSTSAFLDRLKQIYLSLTGVQAEVKQEIERVERYLSSSEYGKSGKT